jgi:hypothetical protein
MLSAYTNHLMQARKLHPGEDNNSTECGEFFADSVGQ